MSHIQQGELPGDLTHSTQGRGFRRIVPLGDCPNYASKVQLLDKNENIDPTSCSVIEELAQTLERKERNELQHISLYTLLCIWERDQQDIAWKCCCKIDWRKKITWKTKIAWNLRISLTCMKLECCSVFGIFDC